MKYQPNVLNIVLNMSKVPIRHHKTGHITLFRSCVVGNIQYISLMFLLLTLAFIFLMD